VENKVRHSNCYLTSGFISPTQGHKPFSSQLEEASSDIKLIETAFFYHCGEERKKRNSLVCLWRPKKTPITKKVRESRRWRRRACFSGCYLFTLLQLPRRAAQTPAGLPQHPEKSQFCHTIT